MLQKASTHLIIPEPSEDLIVNEPWSIEFYADGLMDELFADIDEILDTNLPHLNNKRGRPLRQASPVSRMTENAASDWFHHLDNSPSQQTIEYDHLQTLDVPQIVMPNALNRVQTVAAMRSQPGGKVVVDHPSVKAVTKAPSRASLTLGRLLIIGTTLGVAIAGLFYIIQSGLLIRLTSRLIQPNIYTPQAQLLPQPDVEVDLVNYMLGAMAILDQRDATTQEPIRPVASRVISNPTALALNDNQPPLGNLPSPLMANNTPPNSSRGTNVVERIYIPVYQAPSPMRYAPPPIPGITSPLPPIANNPQTSQSNIVKNALNQTAQPGKPATINMLAGAVRSELKPVAVRNTPINVQHSPNLLPTLPVVPFGASLPQQPNSGGDVVPVAALTVASAAPTHTLEGLLELGNKSVALFQVNGVSRRINIGETIGSSGWTLVEVNNGEAVVRRNGEVRSIYAGQKL